MMRCGVAIALCVSFPVLAQKQSEQDKVVHLNQIQVVGTHNSYNMGFAPSEAKYFQEHYAKAYRGLEYHHQTLTQQLNAGVRQLELDISRQLQQQSGRTNLRLRDEGAAPERYRRAVEEYYRRLSGARPKQ